LSNSLLLFGQICELEQQLLLLAELLLSELVENGPGEVVN
jgi:hypothetical protein